MIGENDPGTPEFKFVYYNGKTRQNTYEGAFVYSRTKELSPESMKKVYKIAKDAEVTIMMWSKQKVDVNLAFGEGELDGAAVAKVVAAAKEHLE